MVEISQLWRYPIKSCAGEPLATASFDRYGIVGDRRGMVVDLGGKFLSQRQLPRMALIRPNLNRTSVTLTAPRMEALDVSLQTDSNASSIIVQVQADTVEACDQGDEVAGWLGHFLGQNCRLVWTPDEFYRQVDQRYARPDDQAAFADGYPVLVTTQASLDELNAQLEEPVPMTRFRPNLVLSGTTPFEEDEWRSVAMEGRGITFHLVKPCARCEITKVDQLTGEIPNKEPLRTLTKQRLLTNPISGKKGPMFGQYAVIDCPSSDCAVAVGDTVVVLTRK